MQINKEKLRRKIVEDLLNTHDTLEGVVLEMYSWVVVDYLTKGEGFGGFQLSSIYIFKGDCDKGFNYVGNIIKLRFDFIDKLKECK